MSHVSVTSLLPLLPFLEGLRKGDQLLACQLQALQNKRVKFLSLWEEQHIGARLLCGSGPWYLWMLVLECWAGCASQCLSHREKVGLEPPVAVLEAVVVHLNNMDMSFPST